MIVGIEGVIEHKEPTRLHINTAGIIHEVHTSINTSNALTGPKVRLYVTQVIREDAHLLFGFADKNEQRMFDTVLKINGVGPKVALAICSTFTPRTFAQIVADKDVAMLKRVPGIGPKAAGRILVELSGFVVDGEEGSPAGAVQSEAMLALESLGFKKEAIRKALEGLTGDTATLVKAGLKKLQRL